MKEQICHICNNPAPVRLVKGITEYYQCISCGTIFSEALDNDNMIGGAFEVERNQKQNHLRIGRVNKMTEGLDKEKINILDFGCGNGYLIEDLKKAGYPNVDGFDLYNEKYSRMPEKGKYNVVIAVEVFEHFAHPYVEIDVINRCLAPGGGVMIETGYVNAALEDGHTIDDWFYINPEAGHSTIYTFHGMDLLMSFRGFAPKRHFDNYVRNYAKMVVR